jgi:hypothetical protein
MVSIKNVIPSESNKVPEISKNKPLLITLGSNGRGHTIVLTSTMNNPTNAQNIDQINFPFTSSHFLF